MDTFRTIEETLSSHSSTMISRESSISSLDSRVSNFPSPVSECASTEKSIRMSGVTTTPATSKSYKPIKGSLIEKKRLMDFTRILMKYLETMNPDLFEKAKKVIVKSCEQHLNDEIGYSVCDFKQRLREIVGECYWTRAEEYHKRMLTLQRKEQQRVECLRIAKQVLRK